MAANLPYEFSKFRKYCKQLRRLLRDTKQSLEDIARSEFFSEDQLSTIQLNKENESSIYGVIYNPIAVVIFGQSCWAKAYVVNELFGQSILPTEPPTSAEINDKLLQWRMVKFTYGIQTQVSLALPNSYELLEHLVAHDQPWHTIPLADLELKGEQEDPALETAILEIKLRNMILRDDVHVVVSPSDCAASFEQVFTACTDGYTPIFIYAIEDEMLTRKELCELIELRKRAPKTPVLFICVRPNSSSDLTESEQHARTNIHPSHMPWSRPHSQSFQDVPPIQHYQFKKRRDSYDVQSSLGPQTLYQRLSSLGFLSTLSADVRKKLQKRYSGTIEVECELIENFEQFSSILLYVRQILQALLVNASTMLNDIHNRCLRMFILSAFDMTWDMMITPKRIEYAKHREAELYDSLMSIANCKQEEIRQLIVQTIEGMTSELLQKAEDYEFHEVHCSDKSPPTARELQICTTEIQDLVLGSLNSAVAGKLIGSVDYLRDSFVGTLERCLESLEKSCKDGDSLPASNALRQILNAAYQLTFLPTMQVEVSVRTSSTFVRILLEKMKQLVQALPWKTPPLIDSEWKRRVAADMLASLSESRLARSICSQFRERLKTSHEHFATALRQLENIHSGRLEKTEDQRLKVRKLHAPRLAKFALESTSLRDMILYGMPQLGREIGRGQYGVVYSCDTWAGYSPCAVKSVVPPDDKHWNDLAMEFYYTRSMPEHDRIVQIRGSVIDYTYGNGSTPAVLLVMDRLQRDLFTAIKMGLDFLSRLQVALDVVQGIRFLHSQGLVHRDIKLKNVLLDRHNRAKITDLGFCKPEAMMSGSIVGTPIHMAPELFTGRYDNSVDVYAFGILFWYICAGHVKLPYIFDQCQNKDQLWNSVRKGARPERLPHFDDNCWTLMKDCWAGDPSLRPLLGDVEPSLKAIMDYFQHHPVQCAYHDKHRKSLHNHKLSWQQPSS